MVGVAAAGEVFWRARVELASRAAWARAFSRS